MSRTIRQLQKDDRTNLQKQDDFLAQFSQLANVSKSAKRAKVPRSLVYEWIKGDTDFKQRYEQKCEEALGALEDEAVRRAVEGTVKPIFHNGAKVGTVREYSDTLLIVLLKARAPERYKDRFYHENTGKGGGPMQHEVKRVVEFKDMG